MKIAVLGTGVVGQTIAEKLAALEHDVTMGTRDVKKALATTGKDMLADPLSANGIQAMQILKLPHSQMQHLSGNSSSMQPMAWAPSMPLNRQGRKT